MRTPSRTKFLVRSVIASSLMLAFTGTVKAESLVAIGGGNKIGIFDSSDAFIDIASFKPITGLAEKDGFIGIDLRPSDNKIYGVAVDFETSAFKIYTIDPVTGSSKFVTHISELSYNPRDDLTGIDIDTIADRTSTASLKLVSKNRGNVYAINLDTGALTQGATVAPGFTGVAYTHSDASMLLVAPANTQIYYINSLTQTLAATLFPLTNPSIRTIGRLGLDVEEGNPLGFEITRSGIAYATFSSDNQSTLNTINLNTGAATQTGIFNSGLFNTGSIFGLTSAPVSVVPEPETYAYLLSGLFLIGLAARRRKNIEV